MTTEKKRGWVDIPRSEYRAVARRSVHFTARMTNSNAGGCGIRLSVSDALDMPYVSVRTLLSDGVYTKTDTDSLGQAVAMRQMHIAESDPPEFVSAQQIADALVIREITGVRFETGTNKISPRLRQIILPRPTGRIAVTPLGAAGLCVLVSQSTSLFPAYSFRRAYLGIGGANPQNICSMAYMSRSPLVFLPPNERDNDD